MPKKYRNHQKKQKPNNERKYEFEYDGYKIEKESDFKPMKDRFFGQNYSHYLMNDTDLPAIAYQLEVNESDYRKLLKMCSYKDIDLEIERFALSFIEDSFVVSNEWEYFESDMKAISRKVPDVLIRVKFWSECFPEMESDDLYECDYVFNENKEEMPIAGVYHCINGKGYYDEAKVIWPEFDYMMLEKENE